MKLSLGTLLLSASSGGTAAFTSPLLSSTSTSRHHGGNTYLAMSNLRELATDGGGGGGGGDAEPKKKVLTAADVMAKSKTSASAGAAGGESDPDAPGAQDSPKIFSEAIYDDFQSCLLLLEKRAKEEGALTVEEVEKFEEETGRIVKEMRDYIADPKGCDERIKKGYESQAVIDVTAAKMKEGKHIYMEPEKPNTTYDSPPKLESPPPAVAATPPPPPVAATPPPAATATKAAVDELNKSEDGPSEDAVTFGVARGTTNTYTIPGMEEMSPEEYRAKLQETVSNHQAMRRKQSLSNRGIIGNASSQGYLESLGGGGGTGLGAPGGGKNQG